MLTSNAFGGFGDKAKKKLKVDPLPAPCALTVEPTLHILHPAPCTSSFHLWP